ncbi:uncharacterized protein LOC107037763 [Diachasma alloeum]|uniref:uncharacterized protein LOC107037763 n=1 Tax=Diachasma alloeum TaxID=454923 RepID=UPI0007383B4D|nr:uncharacterized protein LOC107037763 [Diachasma alloeum]
MGTLVYLRASSATSGTTVTLVCAKTKVAPLKKMTIPRLELTAALLATDLVAYTYQWQGESGGLRIKKSITEATGGASSVVDRTLMAGPATRSMASLINGSIIDSGDIIRSGSRSETANQELASSANRRGGCTAHQIFIVDEAIADHSLDPSSRKMLPTTAATGISPIRTTRARRGKTVLGELTNVSFQDRLSVRPLTSDRGYNFIGAERELKNLFDQPSSESAVIRDRLVSDGTQWIFNPPHAPRMGGKWEAAVKSTKHHLRRIIGTSTLTYEEFTTLLTQVEAILNSRPLCPPTNDPQDTSALTPGHFIIEEPLTTVPEPSLQQITADRLNRWEIITQRIQNSWENWARKCIHRYQQIYRWRQPTNEINIGSLVLITDEREPPAKWPLAQVIEIYPRQENLTRVVTLRKGHQEIQRAIHRLVPLPINADLLEDQQ